MCNKIHGLVKFLKCIIYVIVFSSYHVFPFPLLFICALPDVLSMATALDDFIAPDCRFINIRKGQMVYVYSKLVPEEGAGVFWSGSVCARLSFGGVAPCNQLLYRRRGCAANVTFLASVTSAECQQRHSV